MPKKQEVFREVFRIGIFIDGYTMKKVNEYYQFHHHYHAHLDFRGLKNWVRTMAQKVFKAQEKIVELECHYYHPYRRPEMLQWSALGSVRLERELHYAGIQVHYNDSQVVEECTRPNMRLMEDALLFSAYHKIDGVVLFSTQGQYGPLPGKLRSMGIPTLLLGWNFSYPKEDYMVRWKTDNFLKESSSFYVAMERVAEKRPPNLRSLHGIFQASRSFAKVAPIDWGELEMRA